MLTEKQVTAKSAKHPRFRLATAPFHLSPANDLLLLDYDTIHGRGHKDGSHVVVLAAVLPQGWSCWPAEAALWSHAAPVAVSWCRPAGCGFAPPAAPSADSWRPAAAVAARTWSVARGKYIKWKKKNLSLKSRTEKSDFVHISQNYWITIQPLPPNYIQLCANARLSYSTYLFQNNLKITALTPRYPAPYIYLTQICIAFIFKTCFIPEAHWNNFRTPTADLVIQYEFNGCD